MDKDTTEFFYNELCWLQDLYIELSQTDPGQVNVQAAQKVDDLVGFLGGQIDRTFKYRNPIIPDLMEQDRLKRMDVSNIVKLELVK